ncbi:hypothetical protein COBT_000054 [Conglomerata obtusa]
MLLTKLIKINCTYICALIFLTTTYCSNCTISKINKKNCLSLSSDESTDSSSSLSSDDTTMSTTNNNVCRNKIQADDYMNDMQPTLPVHMNSSSHTCVVNNGICDYDESVHKKLRGPLGFAMRHAIPKEYDCYQLVSIFERFYPGAGDKQLIEVAAIVKALKTFKFQPNQAKPSTSAVDYFVNLYDIEALIKGLRERNKDLYCTCQMPHSFGMCSEDYVFAISMVLYTNISTKISKRDILITYKNLKKSEINGILELAFKNYDSLYELYSMYNTKCDQKKFCSPVTYALSWLPYLNPKMSICAFCNYLNMFKMAEKQTKRRNCSTKQQPCAFN